MVGYTSYGQDKKLANDYFRNGEFEKAATIYKSLHKEHQHNTYYIDRLLACWQALEDYKKAATLITERIEKYPKQMHLWVLLGYNYELQHQNEEAKIHYEKAFKALKQESGFVGYQIAKSFYDNHLLDYALDSYLFLVKNIPKSTYTYQIAAIYGEKGDIENMFKTYLNTMDSKGDQFLVSVQRYIGRHITDDSQDPNNLLFRKLLIQRLQDNPKDEWNKLLSWLYLQQKDYSKALIQEKAIYRRGNTDLSGIFDVGVIAFETQDYTTTQAAFNYIIDNSSDTTFLISSYFYLLESKRKIEENHKSIEKSYQDVFDAYGWGNVTTEIQVSYADFLTFDTNQPQKAISVLEKSLTNPLTRFQEAKIKIQLADIWVFTGKYNQALVGYSQVQTKLKNHILAQEARYKVARTSYYKGDFEWANIQLKVLKRGTTKLISNDALDLSLLIGDNIAEDSIKIALKSYATAELLGYQNKNQQAIDTLSHILKIHKGHPIEDEALFKQAQLYEKQQNYQAAAQNYLKILELKENDILIDDALFHLAHLYDTDLENPEKAQSYYEKIVLEQASSIYLVPARKRYRKLRGDVLVP